MINVTSMDIRLFCAQGYLSEIVELAQSSTFSNDSCSKGDYHFIPKFCSYSDSMGTSQRVHANLVFNKYCKGRTNCSYPIDQITFGSSCTSGYQADTLVYFMEASC
jgi:hypothetical protein